MNIFIFLVVFVSVLVLGGALDRRLFGNDPDKRARARRTLWSLGLKAAAATCVLGLLLALFLEYGR